MEPNQVIEPKPVSEDKELKKLFESYVKVLEHKLGRTPTAEEVAESMKQKPVETDPQTGKPVEPLAKPEEDGQNKSISDESKEGSDDSSLPKILKYMIYYGMKPGFDGNSKEPDPNCVLYYGDDKDRIFDIQSKQWLDKKPPIVDHLPSRPLDDRKGESGVSLDVLNAILHGVMDESDYAALDKSGIIDSTCKSLWDKVSILKRHMEAFNNIKEAEKTLEKSTEAPEALSKDDVGEEEDPWVAAKYARQAAADSQQPETAPSAEDDYEPLDDIVSDLANIPAEFMAETGGEDQVGLSDISGVPANAVQVMIAEALDRALKGRLAEQIEMVVRKVLAEKEQINRV